MKHILMTFTVLLTAVVGVTAQTTPTNKVRSNDSFTQVDNYLVAAKRLGIPTGATLSLDASTASSNTAKLFWRTSDSTLHVYIPQVASWLPAGGSSVVPTLQQVTDAGKVTSNDILVTGQPEVPSTGVGAWISNPSGGAMFTRLDNGAFTGRLHLKGAGGGYAATLVGGGTTLSAAESTQLTLADTGAVLSRGDFTNILKTLTLANGTNPQHAATYGQLAIEALDEGGGVGYRISGRNPDYFGPIGHEAVDFSFNQSLSSTAGATGVRSFASGYAAEASGNDSFAAGYGSTASGTRSFSVGTNSTAIGENSISIGANTTAQGLNSTSIGNSAIATGAGAIALGYNNSSTGSYATSMGFGNIANEYASLAIGRYSTGGAVQTSWTPGSPILKVGNGSNVGSRANAYVLYNDGSSTQAGQATVNGLLSNDDINVVGDANIAGDVKADAFLTSGGSLYGTNANVTGAVNVGTNAQVDGNLNVTGTTTLGGATSIDNILSLKDGNAGTAGIFFGSNPGASLRTNLQGQTLLSGLSTTTPSIYLRPNGETSSSGEVTISNTGAVTVTPSTPTSADAAAHRILIYRQAGQLSSLMRGYDENSNDAWILRSYDSGGVQFTLSKGGINASGPYNNTSDIRIKDTLEYDYSAVDSLRAISFKYKDDRDNGRVHVGYIAQEVQEVLPDAVYEQTDEEGNEIEDGLLSVDHVQVLIAKVALLEKKIKELETRLEAVENDSETIIW